MNRSSDFHLLDYLSLAVERGIPDALQNVSEQIPIALGPVIEILSLRATQRGIAPLLRKFQAQKMLRTLRAAQARPMESHFGKDAERQWGFFCLRNASADVLREPLYGFELAARKALQLRNGESQVKSRICGALQELIDNILDHSGAPDTGIAGFLSTSDVFEMSVGDAGLGMLASIRSNPTFTYLMDAGGAMAVGLADGKSRYGLADRGYGFGTLFRALNTLNASLRFRSGDYVLEVNGKGPTLRNARISQKAALQGFVVSLKLDL